MYDEYDLECLTCRVCGKRSHFLEGHQEGEDRWTCSWPCHVEYANQHRKVEAYEEEL